MFAAAHATAGSFAPATRSTTHACAVLCCAALRSHMMVFNGNASLGSGSSLDLSTLWTSLDSLLPNQSQKTNEPVNKSIRYADVITCTSRDDVMHEFRMNGIDSPFDPDDDLLYGQSAEMGLSGMGPSSPFLRQKSWPAPERTPPQRLPRPQHTSPSPAEVPPGYMRADTLTEEQRRVLYSLPRSVVKHLLKVLSDGKYPYGRWRGREGLRGCAFCRSNGERAAWCESHALRVGGRVCCPVLRAFVCRRCGARGDNAHTINYCPQASQPERQKSAAIMRSIRDATGRRRALRAASLSSEQYFRFGQAPPSVAQDEQYYNSIMNVPLDAAWAAVERKLIANN